MRISQAAAAAAREFASILIDLPNGSEVKKRLTATAAAEHQLAVNDWSAPLAGKQNWLERAMRRIHFRLGLPTILGVAAIAFRWGSQEAAATIWFLALVGLLPAAHEHV